VFDRDLGSMGQTGTPGSSFGIDYTTRVPFDSGGNAPYTATVTYDNRTTLVSNLACIGFGTNTNAGCGDVWGTVSWVFNNPFIATTVVTPTTWVFFQDTDLVVAPEPLTLALTGAGLFGLIAYRKRRQSRRQH
jgi:hypothetical protein